MLHLIMSAHGLDLCVKSVGNKPDDIFVVLNSSLKVECSPFAGKNIWISEATLTPKALASMLIEAKGRSVTWY